MRDRREREYPIERRRSHKEREIRRAFQDLIDDGILVPTGEMRRSRTGELEMVYVLNRGEQ